MGHIVLLGDSIFDNAAYVPGEPDVVRQLRELLPEDWSASLAAVDGAVTRNVAAQLSHLPGEASHLAVSVGGNDALTASHILGARAETVGDGVAMLAEAQARFAADYSAMLAQVLERGLPTALATIYDTPRWAPNHRIIRTALAVFNDVITRAAFEHALTLIDLRLICADDEDYANPIEPSAKGGAKIAAAIARFLEQAQQGTDSLVLA